MDFEKTVSIKLRQYFNNNIKLLFISEYRITIMTKEYKVFELKKNLETLVNLNKNIDSFIESKIVNELCEQIIDIKNGFYHIIARTIDGKVYCWGYNNSGVLGNGENDSDYYRPQLNQNLSDKQIIDVCCGAQHSLVLTNSGEVYAWGENSEGQIGSGRSGPNQFQLIPIKVNGFNEKVIQISCGGWHSMALTESGRVFSWGRNLFGQLGHNNSDNFVNKPSIVLLSIEIPIKKISGGFEQSLLLSRDGDIYWFGWNGVEKQITPKKIINENKFIDIASHYWQNISIALSKNDIYYVWGECKEEKIIEPKETKFISFNDIFNHYFGITYETTEDERFIDFKIDLIKNEKYLNEFEEIGILGKGAFSQVFRVKNNYKEYAMKKMKLTTETENLSKELKNFFYIENVITVHRNIVQLNELWLENNQSEQSLTLYIQMELCDKSLKEFIKELQNDSQLLRKTLTLWEYYMVSVIFKEILKGVNYLHTKEPQIFHMDLHSGNVLLKKRYSSGSYEIDVKLADFGLAKICEFAQKSQTITSKTSSKPLNVLSNGSYSTRDDIYSLGRIMNELFRFDTNRAMNDILAKRYQKAEDLMREMESDSCDPKKSSDQRLNCETILRERNEWVLTENELNELNAKEEFEKVLNSIENKESLLYSIICYLKSLKE